MADRVVSLRASPAVGVGGMYATSEGQDEVVRTAPQTPSFFDRQRWALQSVEDAARVRVVVVDPLNHLPWAWGFREEQPRPDAPLIATADREKQVVWYLKPVDNGIPNAYTLLADLTIVGAAWYAGTNRENEVVFTILPIGVPDEDKPYWVINDLPRE